MKSQNIFEKKTFKKEQKNLNDKTHKSQKQKTASSFGEVMKLFEEKMSKKTGKKFEKRKIFKKIRWWKERRRTKVTLVKS